MVNLRFGRGETVKNKDGKKMLDLRKLHTSRILCMLVCVVFVILCTDSAFGRTNENSSVGAQDPQIVVSDSQVKQGEEFDVTFKLENNPGITAINFFVSYDTTVMELIGNTDGSLLGGAVNSQSLGDYPYYCGWINALQKEDCVENGLLVTLRFRIKKEAKDGRYNIGIEQNLAVGYNSELKEIKFTAKSGVIQVGSVISGDTNVEPPDDEKVDVLVVNPLIEKVQKMKIKISSKKYSKSKRTITLKYKKMNTKLKVTSYQIWRSTKQNYGYKKVGQTKKTTFKDSKVSFKKGKSYYYKVRGVRKIDGKTYYSQWSRKVKIYIGG